MQTLSRRAFFKRAGMAAAVAGAAGAASGAAGLITASPAGAVTDYDGLVLDQGGEIFNVKSTAYGAKGDTIMATGGSISASSTSFTWTGGSFVSTDAGKVITVQGAGASGAVLSTTIASWVSATQVTLTVAASTTVSSHTFSYGTDDTHAIVNAIVAANVAATSAQNGVVYVPPGIYTITDAATYQSSFSDEHAIFNTINTTPGQIFLWGNGGLVGAGGKPIPVSTANTGNTTFLCAASTAGLAINGFANYEGFMVDGNNIATAPILQGLINGSTGMVGYGSAYMTFYDVWATNSAAIGWTIYASQNNSYYHCGVLNNKTHGLYMDGGAGGHNFWDFQEANSGQYGIYSDAKVTGPAITSYAVYTADMRFYGGSIVTQSSGTQGISKIYLRTAQDYKFLGTKIIGNNLTHATVDLAQGELNGYGIDFSGSTLSSTAKASSPGNACIQVSEGPVVNSTYSFLKTDGCQFLSGDTSVYIEAIESYQYWAIGWTYDGTTYGPYSGTTSSDIDPLLQGRTGKWITPTPGSGWTGTVSYRINANNLVELKGSATTSSGGGNLFTLDAGYNENGSGGTLDIPAVLSTGSGIITVSNSGIVACSSSGSFTVYLDGIIFPPH